MIADQGTRISSVGKSSSDSSSSNSSADVLLR
jgi:hypothetical protein